MFFRQKQSRKKVSAARTFCAAALVFPGLTQYSKVRKTQTEFFTGVYTVDITLQDFERAQQRLKGVLHHTELDLSATFSAMTGGNIYLKYENSQKTGSFKIRGASNKIAALVERGETGAVVASSAGNHAQGVAYAAHRFGIPATIVMPKTAPIAKAKATEGYGATVVLAGDCYDDAYAKAREICEQEHATFLHPYNDPEVIAGQGTLGLEILGDLPTADVVIVPAGGGGLLAGVAACIKQINPRVQVIGVQAEGADAIAQSFRTRLCADRLRRHHRRRHRRQSTRRPHRAAHRAICRRRRHRQRPRHLRGCAAAHGALQADRRARRRRARGRRAQGQGRCQGQKTSCACSPAATST